MLWSDFESSLSDDDPHIELLHDILELVCEALVQRSHTMEDAIHKLQRVADDAQVLLSSQDAVEKIKTQWKLKEEIQKRG